MFIANTFQQAVMQLQYGLVGEVAGVSGNCVALVQC